MGRGAMPRLILFAAMLLGATPVWAQTATQTGWNLRVCADPNRLPFSNSDGAGFENRIAELIADELGVDLAYEWVPFTSVPTVRSEYLNAGKCDLMFGLEDGEEGYLHSLTYFRGPFVFIQKPGADPVSSFDQLNGQTIAIQESGTPPHEALIGRGLVTSIVETDVYGRYGDSDWQSRIVQLVADGDVDLGVAWGPSVGQAAAEAGLTVTPITPEIEPPFLVMLRSSTIGVRTGDDALVNLLDRAIANRWDEIQQILADWHVPLSSLPDPRAQLQEISETTLRIGVVLPQASENAYTGALYPAVVSVNHALELASAQAARVAREDGRDVQLLMAVAPDATTAELAGRRLVQGDRVDALIGGLGEGQAHVLAEVASLGGVPFMNLGDEAVGNGTFQVSATPASYLEALAGIAPEVASWFTVAADAGEDASMVALAAELFPGEQVLVSEDSHVFLDELRQLEEAGPDGILVLLHGNQQLEFLTQLAMFDPGLPVLLLPDQATQTREAYDFVRDTVPGLLGSPRVTQWDASLPVELNGDYASQYGQPLEPAGWAAMVAVTALERAHSVDGDITEGILGLRDLSVGKDGLFFDACTRELRQELYSVVLTERQPGLAAAERLRVTNRTAMAEVTGAIPARMADDSCPDDL